MDSDREFMILGKLVLTFGCLLGLPIWELWKLKRMQASEAETTAGEEDSAVIRTTIDVPP